MGDLLNLFFSDLVIKSKGEKQIYINYIFDQYKNVFYIIQHDIFTLRGHLNQALALRGCWVSDDIEPQNFVGLIYHSNYHKR
jgi:hypothetical protein